MEYWNIGFGWVNAFSMHFKIGKVTKCKIYFVKLKQLCNKTTSLDPTDQNKALQKSLI